MNLPDHEEPASGSPLSLVEASQLVFLDAKRLNFTAHGMILRLTIEAELSYPRVTVLRAFPLSEPHRFLSVRDVEDREIGLIVEPAKLSAENLKLVAEHLERRYFVPVVFRIVAAKERFGTVDWTVETDRGPCRFTTRNLRENVQRPTPTRLILSDVDGNRYDIRNFDDLNSESQELLLLHL
jgi:hypothetical protein